MTRRHIKIGIDVGGTFTHAVALEGGSGEILGAESVPTTHRAEEGVARGVVDSMRRLLEATGINPEDVLLVAHSTTQATNALLEGDVAMVGIIGMGKGVEGWRARSQTNVSGIELAPGKELRTCHRFLDTSGGIAAERVLRAWEELREEGATVCVATEAFGVEDDGAERTVVEILNGAGVVATSASSISRLFGLKIRTRTAVINASMMPLMLETAAMTERAVRESGIRAPLMVMRSDGGIMDIEEMRRRPILTMLSGPAAGVAAALMVAKISDGVFLEVGGTSTDISLIRNGRPAMRSAELAGHRLHIRTLDVRTAGVGGGSMARMLGMLVVDVGPRSAHIAGLRYPAFATAEELDELEPTRAAPRGGDPADYLVLRRRGEQRPSFAITTTEAANLLGLVQGYGSAREGSLEPIARVLHGFLGEDPRSFARSMLHQASLRPSRIIHRALKDHEVAASELMLYGGGGGAWAIVPAVAQQLAMDFRVTEHAEIISALGVAMGMIQETIEQSIIDPSEADLLRLRHEAVESVVRMGAQPDSVEVHVEVDARQKLVRATAQGSPELRADRQPTALSESELDEKALASYVAHAGEVNAMARTGFFSVYAQARTRRSWWGLRRAKTRVIHVLDGDGIVRLRLLDPCVHVGSLGSLSNELGQLIEEHTAYGDAGALVPDVYVLVSARIIDLSGLAHRDQVTSLLHAESEVIPSSEDAVALIVRHH